MTKKKINNYKELTPKVKEQVRELAKKNFIKQKIREIEIGIGSILGITFIPYFVGLWFYIKPNYDFITFCEGSCNNGKIWVIGLLILGIVFCLGLIGYIIWDIIKEIIDSNWNKAYSKAEEELKIEKNRDYIMPNDWWKIKYGDDEK